MKKLALLFAFAAVAVAAQPNSDDGALPPNPNLVVQDIPPIPRSLVQQVEKYTDFRGHGFVDWHPTRREMLVAHRKAGGNTAQLFRVTAPMAEPEQLTDFADPVTSATYEPRDGRYIVFERSSGGNEADQLYRLDLATKQVTLLTNPNERHDLQGWLHRSSRLLTSSVPLDKTAQGGSRERVTQTLRLIDPANPQRKRQLVELPGTGWFVGGVSWDDKRIALGRYISANESQLWLLDIASGKTRQVLPAPGSTERAVFLPSGFKRDNSGIFLLCDRDGEFHQLMFYRFATQRMTPITQHIPWDVGASSSSEDGRLLALHANVDGRDELRLFDARSFKELAAPKLPIGSIGTTQFHRRLAELAFSINGPHGPSLIHTLNPKTGDKVWEYKLYSKPWSGVLSTAGQLVFGGSGGWITRDRQDMEGYFYALDAETGKELWRINLGGDMSSSAMTYSVNGKQMVTMPAGSGIFTFSLP